MPRKIMTLLNDRNYKGVEELFQKMMKTSSASWGDYTAAMWARVRTGMFDQVTPLLDEMRSKNMVISSSAYNCLFFSLKMQKKPLEDYEKLWKQMLSDAVKPHVYGLNLYLERFRDLGRSRSSKTLHPELPAKMMEFYRKEGKERECVGNAKSFSLMLDTAIDFNCQETGMKILQYMKEDHVPLSYSNAMKVLELGLNRLFPPLVKAGYENLVASGGKIDEGTLMEIATLWCKRGTYEDVLSMEEDLKKRFPDSQPSEAFYRLALHAMTKHYPGSRDGSGRVENTPWAEVFLVMHKMADHGHPVESRMLMRRLVAPMHDVETLDRAYYALEDLRAEGVKVRLSDVNVIIRGCSKLRDLDRAFATFAEIPAFGLQPDVSSYRELLGACNSGKDSDAADQVYQQMLNAGIELDDTCRRHLLFAFGNQKFFRKAKELVGNDYASTAPEVLHTLIFLQAKSKDIEGAKQMYEEVRAAVPSFKASKALREALGLEKPKPIAASKD